MPVTYESWLVLLSIGMAIQGAYVGLSLAVQIGAATGLRRRLLLAGAAFSLAVAIWTMHFIGMLALRVPFQVDYLVFPTLLSFLVCVLVVGAAVYATSSGPLTLLRLTLSSCLMGGGIFSMHYIGMSALSASAYMVHDRFYVAASMAIAIAASGLALWLATGRGGRPPLILSAIAFGFAVSGHALHRDAGLDAVAFRRERGQRAGAVERPLGDRCRRSSPSACPECSCSSWCPTARGRRPARLRPKQPRPSLRSSWRRRRQCPWRRRGTPQMAPAPRPNSAGAVMRRSAAWARRRGALPVICRSSATARRISSPSKTWSRSTPMRITLMCSTVPIRLFCPLAIGDVESRLDNSRFVRIHRSHIVNIDRVVGYKRSGDNELVEMAASHDYVVPVSRSRIGWLKTRVAALTGDDPAVVLRRRQHFAAQ